MGIFAPVPAVGGCRAQPGICSLICLHKQLGFHISSHSFKYHLADPPSLNFILYLSLHSLVHWDFPGGLVVKNSSSNAGGAGSIADWGGKISHGSGPKIQNVKQKQCCYKFNKDFKNSLHQKIFLKNHLQSLLYQLMTCYLLISKTCKSSSS